MTERQTALDVERRHTETLVATILAGLLANPDATFASEDATLTVARRLADKIQKQEKPNR